jgi:hypothetical protein
VELVAGLFGSLAGFVEPLREVIAQTNRGEGEQEGECLEKPHHKI